MYKNVRVGSSRTSMVIVGVASDDKKLPRGLDVDADTRAALKAALDTPGFKANTGDFVPAGHAGGLIGIGKKSDLKRDTLVQIGGRALRAMARIEAKACRIEVSHLCPASIATREDAGRLVGEGIGLANWTVDFFDGTAAKDRTTLASLTVSATDTKFRSGLKEGVAIAGCVNEARRIGATPPNICNPPWVASEARKMARAAGLTCRVINFAKAKELGMGGIVNVGKGSKAKPCLISLEHTPKGKAKDKPVVLVGKTITYDTGGYSLKIQGSMRGMKYDKCGGTAVFGAMRAIAELDLPVRVVGLLPAAENMVSDEAYRPDDIITMHNGVTVEVTNTDAEGRLVLADSLAYACKKYKPRAILDTATLTGGVVVALGSWSAGLWCNDDDLLKRVEKAAKDSTEPVWRLPLWSDHRDFMRAKHADIWNSGPKRDGHPIQGAAFLSFFVDDDVPWAHIDIAGMADVESDTGVFVPGPTGYGVRLLTQVVKSFAANR